MSRTRSGWQRYRNLMIGGLAASGLMALAGLGMGADEAENPAAPAAQAAPAVYDLAGARQAAITHQPALTAAQESLAVAEARKRAVDKILVPTLLQRDLPLRKQQSCLGIQVAAAGVNHAEWEAVYATTRNYFSVLFARQQLKVADDAAENLKTLSKGIEQLLGKGERKSLTKRDMDKVDVYFQIVDGRREEAVAGVKRATAALREAIGLSADAPLVIADSQLPSISADATKEQLLEWALTRRGEVVQVTLAADVVCLEAKAQSLSMNLTMKTFASAGDVHAQQVPQGVRNGEYRPGALLMEMPPFLAGGKNGRVEQANALHARAQAVVEKTRNLVALEVEDNYLKMLESRAQMAKFAKAANTAKALMDSTKKAFDDSDKTTPDDALNTGILFTQAQLHANEAHYHYLLALAALERITAGGFAPGFELPKK